MKTGFEIRMQADDLLNAYHMLRKNNGSAHLAAMVPSVVCLAFAVEIYLKHLHFVVAGGTPKGHNICNLFEKLPPEIREKVFAHKAISVNPFMTRGDTFIIRDPSQVYTAYDGFIDQMKRISDGFEKWRYSYESGNLKYDSYFALAFIEAVAATADNIEQNIQR